MRKSVILRLKQRRMFDSPPRPRRRWLQTFSAMLQAALLEPRHVEITHQRIVIPNLPHEFHGFRIAQLSDIHHSPFLSEAEIAAAVRQTNDLHADLIALTGDYVSHSPDYIAGCARALGQLRAPHGVFAVLGNHDHWTDGPATAAAFVGQGIRVLDNENLRIERDAAYLRLVGVDDLTVGRDDLQKALLDTTPEETRILLSHNPRIIREAARAGIDLVLSGHTHGGQINWRLLTGREDRKVRRWLQRPSRRLMRGHAQLGGTQLYVNRGLGTVVVPLRYGCPPEITLL
ncbi:MAG TPA: metallophosphoesterase, partial [Blastocatellia bacterium]|nr:metallophosphoesterase [Blastocatellia bacterium]